MVQLTVVVALLASGIAQAHYTFPHIAYNGQTTQDWEYVRETTNHYSNGPVTDVTSSQMTCYQLAAGSEGAKTMTVTAGSTIEYDVSPDITHPGPLSVWIGQVPSGQTAATWDGSGAHWTKIFQDQAIITSSSISWPNLNYKTVNITIPKCLANGDYLLRPEHIGLHSAGSVGGAQIYLSCAQITVTGGTGTYSPKNPVSIPGAYTATDPGLLINIYWPIPKTYTAPGPAAETC